MPDITYKFVATDDVTPVINNIKAAMVGLAGTGGAEGTAAGLRKAAQAADAASASIKGAASAMAQMKELTAGIGYNIGLWNVGFMASQAAIGLIDQAWKNLTGDFTVAWQTFNRQGGFKNLDKVNEQFTALKDIASETHTSIVDTRDRFNELVSVGMTEPQAYKTVKLIQDTINKTGIDITGTIAKTELFKASLEDIAKLSLAEPFQSLYKPTTEALKKEAWRPYEELRRSVEYTINEQALADRTRVLDREIEATTIAVNREMQDRHRGIEYEMADRHRFIEQAVADEERLHNLRVSGLEAISGAMDVLAGKQTKTPMGYVAAEALRPEYESGLVEMARDTGLAVDQLREAVREGMSPAVVLHYAEAARETKRITEGRKLETEEIRTQRGLEQESIKVERQLTDMRIMAAHLIQDQQLKLQRDYTNQRMKDEIDIARVRLEVQLKAQQLAGGGGSDQKIKEYINALNAFAKKLNIPGIAEGGIITKPTVALVGERGPEAIIPLPPGKHTWDINPLYQQVPDLTKRKIYHFSGTEGGTYYQPPGESAPRWMTWDEINRYHPQWGSSTASPGRAPAPSPPRAPAAPASKTRDSAGAIELPPITVTGKAMPWGGEKFYEGIPRWPKGFEPGEGRINPYTGRPTFGTGEGPVPENFYIPYAGGLPVPSHPNLDAARDEMYRAMGGQRLAEDMRIGMHARYRADVAAGKIPDIQAEAARELLRGGGAFGAAAGGKWGPLTHEQLPQAGGAGGGVATHDDKLLEALKDLIKIFSQ